MSSNLITRSSKTGCLWAAFFDVLKPEEAWSIDIKLDDGLASNGGVVAQGTAVDCFTADEYNVTHPDIACKLRFAR